MAIELVTDLRHMFGDARDQGSRPTCLAFAMSDAHAAGRGPWEPLSCEFLFYHAHRRAGTSPSRGTSVTPTLAALKGDGQPLEADWPYLDALPPDLALYGPPTGVSVYRRDGEIHPERIDEVVTRLDQGAPLVLLMMISDAFYAPDSRGVVVAPPAEPPDPQRRHAVVAVGHGRVDGERSVLVRNSWGAGWGLAGHAWLPESFLSPRLTRAARLTENVDVSRANPAS